ncbi:hypothetical protein V6N11_076963 [Hibiscus sabdariffa]|uniref:Uncharacterized protein n=1 Tax=Hibiscus sabdariffa TaxID=183260 RepID=A0ABR2TC44_9ROSI
MCGGNEEGMGELSVKGNGRVLREDGSVVLSGRGVVRWEVVDEVLWGWLLGRLGGGGSINGWLPGAGA